jgi:hypothetical protein
MTLLINTAFAMLLSGDARVILATFCIFVLVTLSKATGPHICIRVSGEFKHLGVVFSWFSSVDFF